MWFDLLFSNPLETQMVAKLIFATLLGGILGYEREMHERPAGFRTHILVAMGAAVFSLISISAFSPDVYPNADPSRMAAYVIVGIGFIGAGTVIQIKDKVMGLTTAASLWLAASIGVSVALEYYLLAISATVIGFLVLYIKTMESKFQKAKK